MSDLVQGESEARSESEMSPASLNDEDLYQRKLLGSARELCFYSVKVNARLILY